MVIQVRVFSILFKDSLAQHELNFGSQFSSHNFLYGKCCRLLCLLIRTTSLIRTRLGMGLFELARFYCTTKVPGTGKGSISQHLGFSTVVLPFCRGVKLNDQHDRDEVKGSTNDRQ